jgi:hypothetical protein
MGGTWSILPPFWEGFKRDCLHNDQYKVEHKSILLTIEDENKTSIVFYLSDRFIVMRDLRSAVNWKEIMQMSICLRKPWSSWVCGLKKLFDNKLLLLLTYSVCIIFNAVNACLILCQILIVKIVNIDDNDDYHLYSNRIQPIHSTWSTQPTLSTQNSVGWAETGSSTAENRGTLLPQSSRNNCDEEFSANILSLEDECRLWPSLRSSPDN